jgi:hypothetical protein
LELKMTEDSRWYIAVLVLECEINGEARPKPDLQFRLVEAPDHEVAHGRALELGSQAKHSYRNSDSEEVTWSFRGLADLTEVLDGVPRRGTEVYSTRSRRTVADLVKPREKLTAYGVEANKHKTARQILNGK